jgi:hypothetical protein
VPVLVDAAYLVDPVERLLGLARCGTDVVCFSAKYMGGPNAVGFVCGRTAWIEAVARAGFTSFELGEHRVFGRPWKLDRHTVVGVVAALQEWLGLEGIPGIESTPCRFPAEGPAASGPINCVRVRIGPATGTSAREVGAALWGQNPAIALHLRDDALLAVVESLADGEEEAVAGRIRDALAP